MNNNYDYYDYYLNDYRKVKEASSYTTYTISPYDTMYSIALKYGINLKDLMNFNKIGPNTTIYPGKTIKIPLYIPPSTLPIKPPVYYPSAQIHTVKKGETLDKIAKMYGVSVENIISINNLPSNLTFIGQKLKIPIKIEPFNIHLDKQNLKPLEKNTNLIYTVKMGDDLYKIANKFGVSVDNLKQFNELQNDFLSVGEELAIPKNIIKSDKGTILYVDNIGDKSNTRPQEIDTFYTVKHNDTLESIAKKYGITLDNLKQTNNIDTNYINGLEQLIIPKRVNNSYSIAI